jgi:hypothetical protein
VSPRAVTPAWIAVRAGAGAAGLALAVGACGGPSLPETEEVDLVPLLRGGVGAGAPVVRTGEEGRLVADVPVPADAYLALELEGAPGARLAVYSSPVFDPTAVVEEVLELPAGSFEGRLGLDHVAGEEGFFVLRVPEGGSPVTVRRAAVVGARRPVNLVVIVVDTLRGDHLGTDEVATPHLDRLAADGVVYPRAFAHAPMTLPAHVSLFSSWLPHRSGVVGNGQRIRKEVPLLAEWLDGHGYETRAVLGIGTLWVRQRDKGLDQGFDVYDDRIVDQPRADDVLARLAPQLDALEDHEPFFLFAHFSDPHLPYNAHGAVRRTARAFLDGEALDEVLTSEMSTWTHRAELEPGEHVVAFESEDLFQLRRFVAELDEEELEITWTEGDRLTYGTRHEARFTVPGRRAQEVSLAGWIHDKPDGREDTRARYAAEVEYVDGGVGELLDELRARDLYDSSLIVFTSDHGEGLGEHGHIGHIRHLYDEALHVPLIVKLPQASPYLDLMRASADVLVRHIDVTPTVMDLLDLPHLTDSMGVSLLQEAPRELLAETRRPVAPWDAVALRDDRYKMIFKVEEDSFEMYDLGEDPGETADVFAEVGQDRAEWIETLRHIGGIDPGIEPMDPAVARRLQELGY